MLSEEHPDTLLSINDLAITLKGLSQDTEAIKLIEKCVYVQTLVLGDNHPYALNTSKRVIL